MFCHVEHTQRHTQAHMVQNQCAIECGADSLVPSLLAHTEAKLTDSRGLTYRQLCLKNTVKVKYDLGKGPEELVSILCKATFGFC